MLYCNDGPIMEQFSNNYNIFKKRCLYLMRNSVLRSDEDHDLPWYNGLHLKQYVSTQSINICKYIYIYEEPQYIPTPVDQPLSAFIFYCCRIAIYIYMIVYTILYLVQWWGTAISFLRLTMANINFAWGRIRRRLFAGHIFLLHHFALAFGLMHKSF